MWSLFLPQTFPEVEVTVGMDDKEGGRWPYADTAAAVQAMGAKHVNKDVTVSFPTCSVMVPIPFPVV